LKYEEDLDRYFSFFFATYYLIFSPLLRETTSISVCAILKLRGIIPSARNNVVVASALLLLVSLNLSSRHAACPDFDNIGEVALLSLSLPERNFQTSVDLFIEFLR